jgi:hypothetical protein
MVFENGSKVLLRSVERPILFQLIQYEEDFIVAFN